MRSRKRLPESWPSARGEFEITALNELYLDQAQLHVQITGRGIAWFDTGTHESLLKAAVFVETIEERQGTMIACLEEIALNNGWIDSAVLQRQINAMGTNPYTDYLQSLANCRKAE